MTLQEVRELLKAGFSRDEIMSFSTESTGNAQEEKQTSVQNEQPADENKPDSIAELRALFQEMKDSNNQLMQTIQASNLQNNSVNFVGDDLDKKVDDALSSINPVPTRQKGD